MSTISSLRCYGFLAGVNGIPFRTAYRTFRAEYGRCGRAALVSLFGGWSEGLSCRANTRRVAA